MLFESSNFNRISNDIVSIDVTGWKTTQVTTMVSLFCGLKNLEEIIGLDTWDVSNVTSFQDVFYGCHKLKELDLSGWNVSSSQSFREMFNECESLEKIYGIEDFKFGPDCRMISYMFADCKKLKTLDLSKWNVEKIEWFSGLFYSSGLEHIDLSNWNTDNLYSCVSMFKYCYSLKSMIGLENWDLTKCVDMNHMFSGCEKLETIGNCENLNLERVLSTESMFNSCVSLVLNASKWKYCPRCKQTNMFK